MMLAAKLRALGNLEKAEALEQRILLKRPEKGMEREVSSEEAPSPTKDPWEFTGHTFGFVPLEKIALGTPADVTAANQMPPDRSLQGAQITITIDAARILNYPGSGIRHLFLDFYGVNQAGSVREYVHVNQAFDILVGDPVREVNLPIFVDLTVSPHGVGFKGTVIDVNNETDRVLLDQLKDVDFQQGVRFDSSPQPALVPLSRLAIGLTKALATRNDAVRVQEFRLGLDFSNGVSLNAKLAEGVYIAVQIPDKAQTPWSWSHWVFHRNRLLHREEPERQIPYNYFVFRVSRDNRERELKERPSTKSESESRPGGERKDEA